MSLQQYVIMPLDQLFGQLPEHLTHRIEREGLVIDPFIEYACNIVGTSRTFLPVAEFEMHIPWDELTDHMTEHMEQQTGVDGSLIDVSDLVRSCVDLIWLIYSFIFDFVSPIIPNGHLLDYVQLERWFNHDSVCLELGIAEEPYPW